MASFAQTRSIELKVLGEKLEDWREGELSILADFCVVVHRKSGGNSTNSVAHKRVHNQKDLKSASVHHKSLEKIGFQNQS